MPILKQFFANYCCISVLRRKRDKRYFLGVIGLCVYKEWMYQNRRGWINSVPHGMYGNIFFLLFFTLVC